MPFPLTPCQLRALTPLGLLHLPQHPGPMLSLWLSEPLPYLCQVHRQCHL